MDEKPNVDELKEVISRSCFDPIFDIVEGATDQDDREIISKKVLFEILDNYFRRFV